jgi:hypothetical protein
MQGIRDGQHVQLGAGEYGIVDGMRSAFRG